MADKVFLTIGIVVQGHWCVCPGVSQVWTVVWQLSLSHTVYINATLGGNYLQEAVTWAATFSGCLWNILVCVSLSDDLSLALALSLSLSHRHTYTLIHTHRHWPLESKKAAAGESGSCSLPPLCDSRVSCQHEEKLWEFNSPWLLLRVRLNIVIHLTAFYCMQGNLPESCLVT